MQVTEQIGGVGGQLASHCWLIQILGVVGVIRASGGGKQIAVHGAATDTGCQRKTGQGGNRLADFKRRIKIVSDAAYCHCHPNTLESDMIVVAHVEVNIVAALRDQLFDIAIDVTPIIARQVQLPPVLQIIGCAVCGLIGNFL
ncbi:MAG: hypothetical protein WCH99_01810 [Verrucomicrobiota bacterium]